MLHFISWGRFLTAIFLSTGLYYCIIILLFYRKEAIRWLRKRAGLTAIGALGIGVTRAQDGNVGISQANTMIRGYFDTGTQLLYAIGAVLALLELCVFTESGIKAIRTRHTGLPQGGSQAVSFLSSWPQSSAVFLVFKKYFGYDNACLSHLPGNRPSRSI